jgi:hypothetical protein
VAGIPILIMVGGLPATGKSTVASALVRQTGFAFIRVDRIEQAIISSTDLEPPVGPAGYMVAYGVAAEQLRHGGSVVTECVNPLARIRTVGSRPPGNRYRDAAARKCRRRDPPRGRGSAGDGRITANPAP